MHVCGYNRTASIVVVAASVLAVACSSSAPSQPGTPAPSSARSSLAPSLPAPVGLIVPHNTTAYLLLDLTSIVCTPRPSCVATLPAAAALLKKARDSKAFVLYTDTPTAGSQIRAEVAPQADEVKVTAHADKFFGTQLDEILKQHGVKTLVLAGTSVNGAVLYTAFEANLRGYTVVVAEDAVSSDDPYVVQLSLFQLLNQPGFTNPQNKPLLPNSVTLSRTDLITFQ